MVTRVFLTVDTELAWRHHACGLPIEEVYRRSIEPAGVGLSWQLATLKEHGLQACFFVDPAPAHVYGIGIIERIVGTITAAGQDVQLHFHPGWYGASASNREASAPKDLIDYSADQQRSLLARARADLMAAGAPAPRAFRAGSYAANDDSLDALASLGILHDSSFNAAWPAVSRIDLPPRTLAPLRHAGLNEFPVGFVEDRGGRARTLQICALSTEEMRAALDHAVENEHALVTIVSHSFELATRSGLRRNSGHVRRFEWLCAYLAAHSETMPTIDSGGLNAIPLERHDQPLGYRNRRWLRRQGEQLWINEMIESRRGPLAAAAAAAGVAVGIQAL
jgi:peptidoglycan/xylan/chitin deacetylase (PgdA/CDA1 family)